MKKYITPKIEVHYLELESGLAAQSTILSPVSVNGDVEVTDWINVDKDSDYEW